MEKDHEPFVVKKNVNIILIHHLQVFKVCIVDHLIQKSVKKKVDCWDKEKMEILHHIWHQMEVIKKFILYVTYVSIHGNHLLIR